MIEHTTKLHFLHAPNEKISWKISSEQKLILKIIDRGEEVYQ